MPLYSYNNKHKFRARLLRRSQTEAEQLLWSKIRARQLLGLKFRRQHPLDQYILDFFCEERKLAIELDGSQYLSRKSYDNHRTQTLQSLGIIVIRFWDNDVLKDVDSVLEVIIRSITE